MTDRGSVQTFFATEIVLNGGKVYTRTLGESACADPVISIDCKCLDRRFQNAPPRVFAALRTGAVVNRDGVVLQVLSPPNGSLVRIYRSIDNVNRPIMKVLVAGACRDQNLANIS